MTTSNGGKMTAWISITVALVLGSNTITYNIVRYGMDNTNARLDKIEQAVGDIDRKIDSKIVKIADELSTRVEKANAEHANYDLRLDRLETRLALRVSP